MRLATCNCAGDQQGQLTSPKGSKKRKAQHAAEEQEPDTPPRPSAVDLVFQE